MSGHRAAAAFTALAVSLALGCATPIGVRSVSARDVHRTLTTNVLSSGRPSATSNQVLHRANLAERYDREPEAALAELHAELLETSDGDLLLALSELTFLHAERTNDSGDYLAAAAYAYAFLLAGTGSRALQPLDPRERLAADLYNLALAWGLRAKDGELVQLEPGVHPLPFGRIDVAVDRSGFTWAGFRLVRFVPAANLEVRGMRNRYRRTGIGAPLVASLEPASPDAVAKSRIPPTLKVPVTAFLRLEDPFEAFRSGEVRGVLELYSADRTESLEIGGRRLPLEYEPSSSLAYSLEGAAIWDFDVQGLLSGDYRDAFADIPDGLFTLRPHRPGRIPLVLVHGTASSPARWAELINELAADPFVRTRYDAWLFLYNTGSPILYSASLLRNALAELVNELDPEGRDPALRRMVVAGHSQGGLLTKLVAVDSGDRFWRDVSDTPLEEIDASPETRELLEDLFFFEASPYVSRVIFIATPHRGSFLAGRRVASFASRVIEQPQRLATRALELLERNPDRLRLRSALGRVPSSIEDMRPGNRFLSALEELPISARIAAHSIIAVKGEGPVVEGDDGVVKYTSAHLESVPETIVSSSHSTQSHPTTIADVIRILKLHAGEE